MPSSLLKFVKQYSVKIGGRMYPVVKIGNQLWMAENLDYAWDGLSVGGGDVSGEVPHAWYYNNNKAAYGIDGTYKCGLLYNPYAAKYLGDNESTLLPSGWHVPNANEATSFFTALPEFSQGSWAGAGQAARAKNNSVTADWPSNWNGNDTHGLTVLPSGYRFRVSSQTFAGIGTNFCIYSKTIANNYISTASCSNYSSSSGSEYLNVNNANSIRLVKTLA